MAAHRYWRVLIWGGDPSQYLGVSEIEFRTSIGGSDATGSGTATCSSSLGGYAASQAFDNNTGTEWVPSLSGNRLEWIGYDFGSGNDKDIVEFVIRTRGGTQSPLNNFDLQYSDDASAWVTAGYYRGQTSFGAGESRTLNLTSDVSTTFDIAPHLLLSASFPPYTVSASSEYASDYAAWKAFDGDAGTNWVAQNGSTTGWLKVDLGAGNAAYVTSYGVKAHDSDGSRSPRNFTLQGSNDDSAWDTLDTRTGETGWTGGQLRTYTVATPGSYRYYRVNVTANDGGSFLSIGRLNLTTEPAPVNTGPVADAGPDQTVIAYSLPVTVTLAGSATDDGLPDPPGALSYLWTVVTKPGGSTVSFADDTDPVTDVELDTAGEYVLRLTADDGDTDDSDDVTITVVEASPARVSHLIAEAATFDAAPAVKVSQLFVDIATPNIVVVPNRVSHLLVDAATQSDVESLVSQIVVEVATRNLVDPCAAPQGGENLTIATTGPLLFTTWDALGTGVLQAYDELAAPDDADYYGGRKWPWLCRLGPVRRALSDHKGNYEVGRFDLQWADPERRIRQLLASAPGRYTPGREVGAYLVSDAGRRAKVRPYLIAWGVVDGAPTYGSDLSIDLSCRDVVGASQRGWGLDGEALIPKRLVAAPEFPEARADVREMGVPFPLGIISDQLPPVGDAPVITGNVDKDRGYDTSEASSGAIVGDWCGFGDTNGPAPPTDLAWEEVASQGAEMGSDAHAALRYYLIVTSVDADGVEGDAEPFYGGLEATLEASDSALHVTWTASPEAVSYRCYLGWAWYGVQFQQYLEVTGTECTFTRSPTWEAELVVTYGMITPGAQLPSGGIWAGFYRVAAVMAGGVETALSDGRVSGGSTEGRWGVSAPYRRPIRLEWLPVTGATGYRIYRMGIWGPYDTSFDVPSTQCYFDDWNVGGTAVVAPTPPRGAFQPIYVGDMTIGGETWRELLVAGCAISEITEWAYDDGDTVTWNTGAGVDLLVPGYAGWGARFTTPYRDIVGADGVTRRRTVIYARGTRGDAIAAGTATLRVNLEGVEDIGNGSGLVLTDLFDQAIWFLEQLVLQDYATGDWTCPPVFPGTSVCQVNRPSFRAVGTQRKQELSGGYRGAWVVGANGERASAQEWIRRICQSGQFRIGPNRYWQIKAWALDPTLSLAALPHVRDQFMVDRESGDPLPKVDHLANVVPYQFGPPLDATGTEWLGTSSVQDDASIAAATGYGREYPGDQLSLYCLRQGPIAAHAAGQALLYSKLIPHTIEPTGDLRFTALDLGDAFLYDHYRGLGADGYAARPFAVVGWTFLSERRQIQLECLDLGDIVSS